MLISEGRLFGILRILTIKYLEWFPNCIMYLLIGIRILYFDVTPHKTTQHEFLLTNCLGYSLFTVAEKYVKLGKSQPYRPSSFIAIQSLH